MAIGVTSGHSGSCAQPAMASLACWTPSALAAVAAGSAATSRSPAPQAPTRDAARALTASALTRRERVGEGDMGAAPLPCCLFAGSATVPGGVAAAGHASCVVLTTGKQIYRCLLQVGLEDNFVEWPLRFSDHGVGHAADAVDPGLEHLAALQVTRRVQAHADAVGGAGEHEVARAAARAPATARRSSGRSRRSARPSCPAGRPRRRCCSPGRGRSGRRARRARRPTGRSARSPGSSWRARTAGPARRTGGCARTGPGPRSARRGGRRRPPRRRGASATPTTATTSTSQSTVPPSGSGTSPCGPGDRRRELGEDRRQLGRRLETGLPGVLGVVQADRDDRRGHGHRRRRAPRGARARRSRRRDPATQPRISSWRAHIAIGSGGKRPPLAPLQVPARALAPEHEGTAAAVREPHAGTSSTSRRMPGATARPASVSSWPHREGRSLVADDPGEVVDDDAAVAVLDLERRRREHVEGGHQVVGVAAQAAQHGHAGAAWRGRGRCRRRRGS